MSAITTVRVFPSLLPGDPIEVNTWSGTLHGFMAANVPDYRQDGEHPMLAFVGDRQIPPAEWDDAALIGKVIDLRPVPAGPAAPMLMQAVIAYAFSAIVSMLFGKKPSSSSPRSPREMALASAEGNIVRRNDIVPELAGRNTWHYPDQLCQRRVYFADKRTQAVDVMLCLGIGEYELHETRIGSTPVGEFGDSVNMTVFAPGADVSGHPAHRNWYNCPNVGPTLGGSGIRLAAGTASGTRLATATTYTLTGSSILVPPGGGALPQDWEAGAIVRIDAYTRDIEVVDGGGSFWSPNRDKVRGDFADLGLSVGDTVVFDGPIAGTFKVVTLTSETDPGTASSIVGVVVAALDYAAVPSTLYIAGQTVLLDDDYANAAALATAIDGQVAGVTVTASGGIITVTDDSPYDGQTITLSGNYSPVFGVTPTFVAGTPTRSFDELTLDIQEVFQRTQSDGSGGYVPVLDDNGNPVYDTRMVPAGSLAAGVFSGVSMHKSNRYRIASLVSGELPDGETGTVGFDLVRVLADGSDDPDWSGFSPEATTGNVVMEIETAAVGGWAGWFDVSPSGSDVSRLEYDVFFPGGLIRYNREGKVRSLKVTLDAQVSIDGVVQPSLTHVFTEATPDQLGFTFGLDLPAGAKNIKMRMRRVGAESNNSAYSDRVEWYGARTLLPTATSYAGATTMAMTITGSDLMSAQSQTQVSVDLTRKLGGVATRSIVDFVRYIMTSINFPEARIDEEEFDRIKGILDGRGDWFDYVFREQVNARDQINKVLAAGFSQITMHQGLAMPVRDEAVAVAPDCFSRHNMLRDSYSCSWTQPNPEADFDGVDVTYIDPATGKEAVVECRLPGDLGLRVQRITAYGVTSRTRAWRIGMRQRRRQRYQVWQHEFDTEMDAFNCRLLSQILIVPDVPGYAQSAVVNSFALENTVSESGSVVSGDVRLAVSEVFAFETGVTHAIAWRMPTGKLAGPFDAAPGTSSREVVALDVPAASFPVLTGRQEPPHAYFGRYLDFNRRAVVSSIAPEGVYKAKVQAVNYDDRIFEDDDNAPS